MGEMPACGFDELHGDLGRRKRDPWGNVCRELNAEAIPLGSP